MSTNLKSYLSGVAGNVKKVGPDIGNPMPPAWHQKATAIHQASKMKPWPIKKPASQQPKGGMKSHA